MDIFIGYLIVINLLSFYSIRSDKRHARFSRYKIGERTFLLLAFLGGSIGLIIGMNYYKYLLNKKIFRLGVPIIFIAELVLFLIYIF